MIPAGSENAAQGLQTLAASSQHTQENSTGNSAEAQRQRILARLRISPLTTLEARRDLDVLHPAARVMELRDAGYDIDTVWTHDLNGEGRPHRVAQYILLPSKEVI